MTGTAPAVGASTPKATSLAVNIDVAHGDDIQSQNQNTNLAAASDASVEDVPRQNHATHERKGEDNDSSDVWRLLLSDAERLAVYLSPITHAIGLLFIGVAAPIYTLGERIASALWKWFLTTPVAKHLSRRDLDPTFPAFVALIFVIAVCRTSFTVTPTFGTPARTRPTSVSIDETWDASLAWQAPAAPPVLKPGSIVLRTFHDIYQEDRMMNEEKKKARKRRKEEKVAAGKASTRNVTEDAARAAHIAAKAARHKARRAFREMPWWRRMLCNIVRLGCPISANEAAAHERNIAVSKYMANQPPSPSEITLKDIGTKDIKRMRTPLGGGMLDKATSVFMNQAYLAQRLNRTTARASSRNSGAENAARLASSGCVPLTDIRHRFDTCAVVGNSGVLLKTMQSGILKREKPAGDFIDAHEAVFRFNEAPTRGYEVHVGQRTTFTLLSRPTSVMRQRSRLALAGVADANSTYVLLSRDTTRKLDVGVCRQLRRTNFERELLIPSPELVAASDELYRHVQNTIVPHSDISVGGNNKLILPSNCRTADCRARMRTLLEPTFGSIGVYLSLTMCRKVNLFGFGLAGDASSTSKYYHIANGENDIPSYLLSKQDRSSDTTSLKIQGRFLKAISFAQKVGLCSPVIPRSEGSTALGINCGYVRSKFTAEKALESDARVWCEWQDGQPLSVPATTSASSTDGEVNMGEMDGMDNDDSDALADAEAQANGGSADAEDADGGQQEEEAEDEAEEEEEEAEAEAEGSDSS